MRQPKCIEVLGVPFTISYVPERSMKDVYGDVNFPARLIRIRKGQTDVDTHNTLLHEVIHIVIHLSGMGELITLKMDEALTRALECGLGPLVTMHVLGKVKR